VVRGHPCLRAVYFCRLNDRVGRLYISKAAYVGRGGASIATGGYQDFERGTHEEDNLWMGLRRQIK
jgi:hypothetical protein